MLTQPIVSIVYTPSPQHADPNILLVPMIDPNDLNDYGSQPLALEPGKHDYYSSLVPFIRSAFPDFIDTGRIQIGAEKMPEVEAPAVAPIAEPHPYAGTEYAVLPPGAIADWPGGLSAVAKEHHKLAIQAAMNLGEDPKAILEGWSRVWGLPAGTKSMITRALKSLEVHANPQIQS